MTWTALALVVALGTVAWLALSAVLAFGLGALVARNRTGLPQVAPAAGSAAVTRARIPAEAA